MRWRHEPNASPWVRSVPKYHQIAILFKIPAGGGGTTDVRLTVGRDDFPLLFEAMVQAGGK